MNVYIKLDELTGIDANNFSFSSDIDYDLVLQTGISRSTLTSVGYTLTNVQDGATVIRIKSNTTSCINTIDLAIDDLP